VNTAHTDDLPDGITPEAMREAQKVAIWLRMKLAGPEADEYRHLMETAEGREEIVRRAQESQHEMRVAFNAALLEAGGPPVLPIERFQPQAPPPLQAERTDRAYRRKQWQQGRKRGAGFTRAPHQEKR